MSDGCNHHQHQQHHLQHIGSFLPTLCSRPSMIKDVHVPHNFSRQDQSSISSRRSEDPSLSPRVGCMGQVKKLQHQNYKPGMVFPTSTTSTTAVAYHTSNFSYSKLFRFFSSKTLLAAPSLQSSTKNKNCTTNISTSRNNIRSRSCRDHGVIGFGSPINVADLDPPLPVIIKKKTGGDQLSGGDQLLSEGDDSNKNGSLWKRRSGGAALKGLQIQKVHIPIQSTIISV